MFQKNSILENFNDFVVRRAILNDYKANCIHCGLRFELNRISFSKKSDTENLSIGFRERESPPLPIIRAIVIRLPLYHVFRNMGVFPSRCTGALVYVIQRPLGVVRGDFASGIICILKRTRYFSTRYTPLTPIGHSDLQLLAKTTRPLYRAVRKLAMINITVSAIIFSLNKRIFDPNVSHSDPASFAEDFFSLICPLIKFNFQQYIYSSLNITWN